MGIPVALSALVDKRSTLAGDIREFEERLEQLRSDVLHVDAVIRLMDPAYQLDAIVPKSRRQRRQWFGNGEMLRIVLETLRRATDPLTSREVAMEVMERKGFDTNDGATLRLIEKRVDATIRRRGGMVERVVYGPRSVAWKLVT